MRSLRIDQSELKCKNGCDFFGNPQWQGYCSKCYREQVQRQRKVAATATLPKQDKKAERSSKLSSHSSFSKFEEKRLRQSETLKKANLFNMFKKSNTEDHDRDSTDRRPQEFKIPSSVNEGMKAEYRRRFAQYGSHVDKDLRLFVHSLIMDVIKCANTMTVDELSERVQQNYQRFMKHMEAKQHFAQVDAEAREELMDFVEDHAMSYLHELPSVVFSPLGTEDERADRQMSERIQQLGWVGEAHLDCKLDRNSAHCRQLLYKAISELLGVDGAVSPGRKLACVRRCCAHVLALCAPPASADDLLPALIFTVLKANPPRLISNVHFVSRFCNAQRLMTGEAGYYFTNLCCAVSFIENMTAESLNMDKEEYDCYMTMPASIGGSSWAAALSLCAELREAEEQKQQMQQFRDDVEALKRDADNHAMAAETFEKEITKKVEDVLARTPLEIIPRRALPRFGKFKKLKSSSLIDLETAKCQDEEPTPSMVLPEDVQPSFVQPLVIQTESLEDGTQNILDLPNQVQENSPKSQNENWDKQNSMDLLTPSPLGFTYDTRSIDELMTPEEFANDNLPPGLSNINYDIDLSDFSGDNSAADETPRDPFSPDGLKKTVSFDPFTQTQPKDPFSPVLESFQQFQLDSSADKTAHRQDPFSMGQGASVNKGFVRDPFDPVMPGPSSVSVAKSSGSILDDNDSPTSACLLPSPLLPQSSNKK